MIAILTIIVVCIAVMIKATLTVKKSNKRIKELEQMLDDEYKKRETRLRKVFPCVGHDMASWEEEDKLNERIDIIGQNGNEGTHYDIQ